MRITANNERSGRENEMGDRKCDGRWGVLEIDWKGESIAGKYEIRKSNVHSIGLYQVE